MGLDSLPLLQVNFLARTEKTETFLTANNFLMHYRHSIQFILLHINEVSGRAIEST